MISKGSFMSHTAASKVAFIFDCDGTLVNSTPVWAYAQPELLHRHGVDVTVDDFAQFEHLSLEDECQAYHDTWGIGANGEELYRELSNILIDGYSKVPPRKGLSLRSLVPGSTITWSLLPRRARQVVPSSSPTYTSWRSVAWKSATGASLSAHGCLRTRSLALRALAPQALSAWASMTRTAV